MRPWFVVLALCGCPKSTPVETPEPVEAPEPAPPVEEVVDAGPVVIQSGSEVDGRDGRRVTLLGTLERRTAEGAEVEGTAVVFADGGAVWVAEGDPPEAWAWMVGTRIRIQGTLAAASPSGLDVAWLSDPEPPMPGDAGMPMEPMPF